jgi:ribosomal protein L11 methylase PrmA
MAVHGQLLISGFYQGDLEDLKEAALTHGFVLQQHITKNDWCAAVLKLNTTTA